MKATESPSPSEVIGLHLLDLIDTFSVVVGRRLRRPTQARVRSLGQEAEEALRATAKAFEAVASKDTPGLSVHEVIGILQQSSILPQDVSLSAYLDRVHRVASAPRGRAKVPPCNFGTKHRKYRRFLTEIVARVGADRMYDFLHSIFDNDGTREQLQRAMTSGIVPAVILRQPNKVTNDAVQRQISAWRIVAADWDRLICIGGRRSRRRTSSLSPSTWRYPAH